MLKTIRFFFVALLIIGTLKAQSASALWELSSVTTTSVSVSGNVVGQAESFSDMVINNYSGPNNSQRVTTTTGSWPAETDQNENRYIQFAVSPETGYHFTVTSVTMDLGASGGSNMRANIWYSKDPSFSSATQLNTSALVLPNGSFIVPSPDYSISETVEEGETFYLRIFPWYLTSSTGKYVCPQNVLISGIAGSSSAIIPSVNSLDLGTEVAGNISSSINYSVEGVNLSENVLIEAQEQFEVSLDNITFLDSLLLPIIGGTLPPTSIYVHFTPLSPNGTINGIIQHTSGVVSTDISVTAIALATEPTISSSISFGTVTGNSITANFSGGNGSNRIVVVKQGSAVNWEPLDGNIINGVNSDFSLAADQGDGNKVVYDGIGSSINVTGLTGSTTYYFAVYEYNLGTNNSQNYLTSSSGTGNQTTTVFPTIIISPASIEFGSVPVNTSSTEETYILSANYLSPLIGNITITAPQGFEVSLTSGAGFSSSLILPYSNGELNNTNIYVRFYPQLITTYNGNITNAGGSALTQNVVVSGNGIPAGEPNVFQAEDAVLFASYVRTQYPGFTGSGYIDLADRTGSNLEFVFKRDEASIDTITIYFANGLSSRSLSMHLNDILISSPSFSGTGSWTNWSNIKVVVPLVSGLNRLKFTSTTNGSNPNIDKIFVGGAYALPMYKLILESSGSGSVSATPPETYYESGTNVTFSAFPSTGNTFFRWGGTENVYTNPYIVSMNSHKTVVGIMMDTTGFASFPYEPLSKGFASVDSWGYSNGTTGGSGDEAGVAFITTSTELVDLMYNRVDVSGTGNLPPLTVFVIGTLVRDSGVNNMIDVKDAYDISIIGVGGDATFSGVGLKIVRSSNIIVRNILFMNAPDDGINIQADDDETLGNHIWIDHCSFTNCYDGALDVTHTPSYVTLSWNHFYNHDKTSLMGHSDTQVSDTAMKVTYHHNFFDGTNQRHPRIRFGKAHVFNNYYLGGPATLYGVSSNLNAQALVEGNYFNGVPIPTETSRDGSPPGNVVEQDNIFINCGTPGTGGTVFEPSTFYSYSLDPAANVPALLTSYAGSGKYDFSLLDTLVIPLIPDELNSFEAATFSSSEINLSFTPNGSNDDVVIVWNTSGTFTSPSSIPPAVGEVFAGGIMLYNGIISPQIHSGLSQSTTYFYKAFSYNGSYYSSGLMDNATTQSSVTTFPLSVTISDGWNMVSVPGTNSAGMGVSDWWPGLTGQVFEFALGSGYNAITTTNPTTGYWMKHTGATVYNYPAIEIVTHDPIPAASGWNMIGGYEDQVAVGSLTTNPSGQLVLPIYAYVPGAGYGTATNLEPGVGYWAKVSSACDIIVPDLVMAKGNGEEVEYFSEEWGRIVMTDAEGKRYTLYAVNGEVDLDRYELPPLPPQGMFDIRYNSGRIAEDINSSVQGIDMSGVTYPLTVRVENMDMRLMDETGKKLNENVKDGEEIVISDSQISKLMVSGELLPTVYALEQNYPNPFNPSTTIEFSLPEDVSSVKLSIYSILGEKVAELVNTSLVAGKYQYQWNAQNVATGMYIYELRTDKFSSTKKMILLK
jgi:pectate lyase